MKGEFRQHLIELLCPWPLESSVKLTLSLEKNNRSMNSRGRTYSSLGIVWVVFMATLSLASNVPGKPTNLQVTGVKDLTINLTWRKPLTTSDRPDNSSLTYRVRFRDAKSPAYRSLSALNEIAQIDLVPSARFDIYVKAIRRFDQRIQGNWSEALQVDSSDFVPAKPTGVRMVSVDGLKVKIGWTKPQTTIKNLPDSSELNYHVAYTDIDRRIKRQIMASSESASLFTIANSRYSVKVRAVKAFNNKVVGHWSKAFVLLINESTPSKPPSAVKVISNTSSSIFISWSPIPANARNGVVRGYVVFYRKEGAANWSIQDVKGALSWELTGLVSGRQYLVRVAGYTKKGNGKRSSVQKILVTAQRSTTMKVSSPTQGAATTLYIPQTGKLTSTRKPTTKATTKLNKFTSTTAAKRKTQGVPMSTELPPTVSINPTNQLSTLSSGVPPCSNTVKRVSSESVAKVTGSMTEESDEGTASSKTFAPLGDKHSTPPAVMARKGVNETKENSFNKIIFIAAPVAIALLLLAIVIIFFTWRSRRARSRKKDIGHIPLKTIKSGRKMKRTKDPVTRGEGSIRYEPPSAHFALADDPESERDQQLKSNSFTAEPSVVVMEPNGRATVEETLLLAQGCDESRGHLLVDTGTEGCNLAEGRASRLYESIGSLGGVGDKESKCDMEKEEERYITQEQIAATCESSKEEKPTEAPPHEYSHLKVQPKKAHPQGVTYENVRDSVHLYETLSFNDQRGPSTMSTFRPKGKAT